MSEIPIIAQPTLTQFENIRKGLNYIPLANQGVVFEVGKGLIKLFNNPKGLTEDNLKESLDLEIYSRTVNSGFGEFNIQGYIDDLSITYASLYVNEKSTLNVQDKISLDGKSDLSKDKKIPPTLVVDGTMNMSASSKLIVKEGSVTFNESAKVSFPLGSELIIDVPEDDTDYYVYIHCSLEIDFTQFNQFINHKNIYIADDVDIIVNNLPSGRYMSLTDWIRDLNKKYQNVNTVGMINLSNSNKVTYRWKCGNPNNQNDGLELVLNYGDVLLGDFDLRLTGIPNKMNPGQQIITDMIIQKDARLVITDQLENGMQYILPRLHITKFNDEIKQKGFCQVFGKILCDGYSSGIELSKGCQLIIEDGGSVHISNQATIQNINSDTEPIIIVRGELILDDISYLKDFHEENIVIEDNGKIIILNNIKSDDKLLFSTPNGIMNSDLYKYFGHRLDKVEYHIPEGYGIKIDEFYEYFSMMKWYNHLIEPIDLFTAIEKGYIIWHNNAYIELDHNIIPYIDESSTLSIVGELFNVYGNKSEKVQETAMKFSKIGAGNITFKFVNGNKSKEITMFTKGPKITRTLYNVITDKYRIYTEGDGGTIYVANNIDSTKPEVIINPKALSFEIDDDNITEIKIDKD